MPQMNPTWWLTLFFLFITIYLLTNTLIYFNKKINITFNTSSNKKTPLNWKW